MLRVWALVGALVVVGFVILLGVGFFGDNTLKFATVILGAGVAAAYLPGGIALSRALYLLVSPIIGALGFGAGALFFSDDNAGVFFGGMVPLLIAGVIAMWSRKQEVFVTILLGVGAFGAVYTTTFFSDPQGLNYSMPIALGEVIMVLGIGYLAGVLIKAFLPSKPTAEQFANPTGWQPTDDQPTKVTGAIQSDEDEGLKVLSQ